MLNTAKVINCVICGKEIEAKSHNKKYCQECSVIVRNRRKPKKVFEPKQAQCLSCKKSYTVTQEWRSTEFCCDACRATYRWRQKFGDPTPAKTLSDWAREARACGLDYGTYRGLIECGRTFEELQQLYGWRRF